MQQHPWMGGSNWHAPQLASGPGHCNISPQRSPSWMAEFPAVDPQAPYHAPQQRRPQRAPEALGPPQLSVAKAMASPFHVFSSSTHRQQPVAEMVVAAPAAAPNVPNDLVSRDEMRRALVQHLQAPAVSESQQAMFKK